jgi:putative transposase
MPGGCNTQVHVDHGSSPWRRFGQQLHVHLVFVVKYRRKVLCNRQLACLEETFASICAGLGGELCEFNGESDHVHLLVTYPPVIAISILAMRLKGASARVLRSKFPEIQRAVDPLGRHRGIWSDSYFAASVGGAPISVLRRYIEQQRRTG